MRENNQHPGELLLAHQPNHPRVRAAVYWRFFRSPDARAVISQDCQISQGLALLSGFNVRLSGNQGFGVQVGKDQAGLGRKGKPTSTKLNVAGLMYDPAVIRNAAWPLERSHTRTSSPGSRQGIPV